MLINNGSCYHHGPDLQSATDADVIDTIASGATGTVLTVKNFLPLLGAGLGPPSQQWDPLTERSCNPNLHRLEPLVLFSGYTVSPVQGRRIILEYEDLTWVAA